MPLIWRLFPILFVFLYVVGFLSIGECPLYFVVLRSHRRHCRFWARGLDQLSSSGRQIDLRRLILSKVIVSVIATVMSAFVGWRRHLYSLVHRQCFTADRGIIVLCLCLAAHLTAWKLDHGNEILIGIACPNHELLEIFRLFRFPARLLAILEAPAHIFKVLLAVGIWLRSLDFLLWLDPLHLGSGRAWLVWLDGRR